MSADTPGGRSAHGKSRAQESQIATRAWVEPAGEQPRSPARWREPPRRERRELLVVDTETVNLAGGRVGPGYQTLLLVGWRHVVDGDTIEEGLAYPDDLPARDPAGYRRLVAYVRTQEPESVGWASRPGRTRPTIIRMAVSRFLEERVYALCYRRRVTLVAHNLGFDFGALACRWAPARPRHDGAFSLSLWGKPRRAGRRGAGGHDDGPGRPRLRFQRVDRSGALLGWTSPAPGTDSRDHGRAWRGRFLDTHTLGYALTGDALTLDAACRRFGVDAGKVPCVFGRLDAALVDHVRADVAATAALADRLLDLADRWATRADRRPVVRDAAWLHSPATLAAALLDALAVAPLADRLRPGVLDRAAVMGVGMEALYGGRAEARVVGQRVPVAPVDFASMYPTCSALLGMARHWRAARIVPDDATSLARELLAPSGLADRLRRPSTWRRLGLTFVAVEPGGEPWPRRVHDPDSGGWRLGVGPLRYAGRLWFAWPDVAAATLATGRRPRIRAAVRLVPRGTAAGVRPVRLASGAHVDLAAGDDPCAALVAERRRVEADDDPALAHGYKVAANALAHGVVSRFDRDRYAHATPLRVTVTAGAARPVERRECHVERPGPWSFPPAAAAVTAAARCILAMLEADLTAAGATVPWAWCDTDGAGVVATPTGGLVACAGGPERLDDGREAIRAVSFDALARILDRFASLHVLGRGSPWRVEHDGTTRPLDAYVVAPKRYALVRDDPTAGAVEVVWASEHGLGGVLADPYPGERDDRSGMRRSVVDAWRYLVDPARQPLPEWAALPTLVPQSATTPCLAARYDVRPGAFWWQARPPLLAGETRGGAVVAPFEADPACWPRLRWSRAGAPVAVQIGGDELPPRRGEIPIGTLGDELIRYRITPIPAGWQPVGPDGAPVDPDDEGDDWTGDDGSAAVLAATPVAADPAHRALIGREAFDEPEHGADRLRTLTYGTCAGCGVPLDEGRATTWCAACHDAHNAGWRRRRLTGPPRCAECGTVSVSRQGARCRDCRLRRDAARKRRTRARAPTRRVTR